MALLHLVQALQRIGADAGRVLDQVLARYDFERRQRGCGRHRVFLMRVVAKGVVAGQVESLARNAGRNRQDATAQRLAQHHDVGRSAVVFGGKKAPSLAQAGWNLVEDQQGAVRVAGLTHGLPVTRRRDEGHGTRRLGDHRCHIALALEHIANHGSAGKTAAGQIRLASRIDRVAIGAAVAAKRCHMLGAGKQRAHRATAAKQRLAANAGGAKTGAVKRIPEA